VGDNLFETALGIKSPWFVQAVNFDVSQRRLTIDVDFPRGTRFAHPKVPGEHPVHDTQIKELRHLNFFQHECYLKVRVPRVRLPDGKVALVEPDWVGKLSGFTLLFEALVLMLAQQMPFAVVARTVGETWHRVHAICTRYVGLALERADLSAVDAVAVDETSYKRGHNYLTLAVDADARRVVFVTEGKDAATIAAFVEDLRAHNGDAKNITSVTIDMSPAFINGVTDNLPNARILASENL
jgi:transposase